MLRIIIIINNAERRNARNAGVTTRGSNAGVRSCIATFYPAERAAAPLHDDVAHVPAARDPAACERERLC